MPLDPRIPLQTIVARPRRIAEVYAEVESERDRAQARRDREDERRRRNKTEADKQAIRDVFAKVPKAANGQIDMDRVAEEVMLIDPASGLELQDKKRTRETAELQGKTAKLEYGLKVAEFLGQKFGGVKKGDQQGWTRVLGEMRANQMDTTGIPEQYDPVVHEQLVEAGYTNAQRIQKLLAEERRDRIKQYQRTTINWKGKEVEVSYDPDTKLFHLPDGSTSTSVEKFQRADSSGDDDSHWRDVEETLPDGTVIVRSKRVRDGDVVRTKAGSKAVTQAQKNQAERWKRKELRDVEQEFRDGDITEDVLQEEKLRIENGYREQIGLEPIDALDASWNKRATPRPTDPPSPLGPGAAVAGTPRAPQPPAPADPQGRPGRPPATPSGRGASGREFIKPMPSHSSGLRAEAEATLRAFNAERDPIRKAALHRKLFMLRQQLQGGVQ